MPRDPVALTLTLETPGGCVSYRRAGATLAEVEAQIQALLREARAELAKELEAQR